MIARIWHGWTTTENADAYEQLLRTEIFEQIAHRDIEGYRGVELFRRTTDELVEFVTVMRFDSFNGVVAFSGEDYERAVVPAEAQALLHDYDRRAAHFDVRMQEGY